MAFHDGPATPLWRSSTPCHALPAGPPLIGAWHLTGTWLHPESSFCIDQLAFAQERAYLYIGCHDRDNPSAPRRFDAGRSSVSHDQGVIAFPLRTFRAVEFHASGYCPETAMLLCSGTAVTEAAVHEALEIHQSSPGKPVLDPHTPGLTINVTIHWGNNDTTTTGHAHTP